MGEAMVVVSGKGGTGKTSFVAGVGSALAVLGYEVLCMDCDAGLRNLDLALGRCSLEEAAVAHPRIPRLHLLTAPSSLERGRISKEQMTDLMDQVRQRYDYCLLDAPAGLGSMFRLAVCAADRCTVVTTTDVSSLRDAQHTVMLLDSYFPQGRLHLVVNRVRRKLLRSLHATIDDAIDTAGAPLLGVIPEDDALPLALNRGIPLRDMNFYAQRAYENIAKRITGQRIPLLRARW